VQGATHRSSLCRVERIHGAHQNFEWIACKRFFALARQAQTYASPVLHTTTIATTRSD